MVNRYLSGISERFSVLGRVTLVSLCLLCASFLLTAYSSRHPEVARCGGVLVSEVVAPIHSAIMIARDGGQNLWFRYLYLVGAATENGSLREQLQRTEGALAAISEVRQENNRLRAILQFSSNTSLEGVVAAVIGEEPSGWVRGILINRGTSSGVMVGMAAVHARGVVGQVIAAGPNSARILLIDDHSSGVDAIVQESRVRAIVAGTGPSSCELKYITNESAIRPGEIVVTSGMDRIYPKGLILGTIISAHQNNALLFQTVQLKPAVDFAKLEEVLIIASEQVTETQSPPPLPKLASSGKASPVRRRS